MNKLKELYTKILDVIADTEIDASATDPRVRAGVEAKVRNAKQDLERVKREYKDALIGHVVVIGVNGSSATEFAASAEKAGAIAVDFNFIVDKTAENLSKRAIGSEFTSEALFKLIDELSKVRLEYDMIQLPTPRVDAYADGIYNAPLREAIAKLFSKNYGSSLQSAVTRRLIGDKGLDAKFTGKKLPVIVYNLDQDMDVRFIPAPVTIITSNGKVTDNGVKKKLAEVKAMLSDKQEETNDSQTNGQSAQTEEEL
jgi:hypothetical protein